MKKLACVLCCCVMTAALAACTVSGPNDTPAPKATTPDSL